MSLPARRARSLVQDDVTAARQRDLLALRACGSLNRLGHAESCVVDRHCGRLATTDRRHAVRALRLGRGAESGGADRCARNVELELRDVRLRVALVPVRDHARVEDVEDEKTAGQIRRRDRAVRGRGGGRVAEHRRLVIDLGRPAEALRCRQTDRAALGGAVFAVDADEWSETKQASLESGGLTAEGRRRRPGARRRGGQPEGGGEKQGHAD